MARRTGSRWPSGANRERIRRSTKPTEVSAANNRPTATADVSTRADPQRDNWCNRKVAKADPSTPPAVKGSGFEAGKLKEGNNKYPTAERANTNKAKKAIEHLKAYIDMKPDTDPNKLAYAHFSLAESYKTSGSFDLAKKQYKYLLDNFADGNAKMLSMARTNLEDMDVIKRLSIGGEPIAFNVKDLEGKPLSIEKFRGKVVLLDFL